MNLIPALPLKASAIIPDADLDITPHKFVGDIVGNLTGRSFRSWTLGYSAGVSSLSLTSGTDSFQLFQLGPGEVMTGKIKCYLSTPPTAGTVTVDFLSKFWGRISSYTVTTVDTEVPVPVNTNGIYVRADSANYACVFSIHAPVFS